MASILRSSKFVRYIAGFARNIVVNTPREFDGNFINTTQCLCGAVPRSLTTQASAQHEQNLDSCLRRLDQDVRRSGRISRRDIEDVLEEIRNARSATSSQSLLVIRCCGNLVPEELPEVRTKLVQEIWNTLRKLNVPMDISHYNALLRVYLENEHEFIPTEFLSELESKGIEPNRVTYQRLISRYCQIGDIEGATKILEYMREKQLPVNENVFNALIHGHSQAGDMESASGILTVMSQAGLEPSADTYTTLMCGYAIKGDMSSIEKLIEECEAKEVFLLDKDFLDVAYVLAANNHINHVSTVLGKTRKAFGYSQDAINTILRLINKGLHEVSYTIFKTIPRTTRADGTITPMGAFFVRQMIKANSSLETILEISQKLEEDQYYDRGLILATECALQEGKENLTYKLLEKMKEQGLPIRQHYFWPLIVNQAKQQSDDGIISVLKEMSTFGLSPNTETIREYVIPNLLGSSADVISKLTQANISVGSAACSLVHGLLLKNDLEEAAVIVQQVGAYYAPDLIKKPLTTSFYKKKNIDAYITVVRHVYENLHRKMDAEPNDSPDDKAEVVGKFLIDLVYQSPRQFTDVAESVLEGFVKQGLSISTTSAEKIEERLGEKMTPEISKLLERLSSGDLTPVPIEKKAPSYTPSSQMNIPQLERLIQNLDAKKQDTKGLKRQLFTLYYRNKELDKMEALLKELEGNPEFVCSPGIFAQLLDTCAYLEKYEDTMKYLNKLSESEEEFSLDDSKIIRVATVMITSNHFDEAIEFLSKPRPRTSEERNFNYNSTCWRLLNLIADQGRADDLETLFNTLVKNELLEINNVNLGPLVKVHLVNKDITKALEKFEWCCNQYRATPWKNELACQLIQNEDAERLQKLTDLSTAVHGEINSLYDLVFAFVECGRIRQARKILETPGLQSRHQRMNYACERYQKEGMVKPLEGLRDATKDLNHINRSSIYFQLLLSYIKQDDDEKALSLWTQMQEEDLPPSDEFLRKLGEFLQKKNIQVPFVMPSNHPIPSPEKVKLETPTPQPIQPVKRDISTFRLMLKNDNLDKALEIKYNSKESFSVNDLSILIEKLLQNERLADATRLTTEMLDKGLFPLSRVFRFLLNKLANSGDVESVMNIGSKLTSDVKKLVSFDNRICHANLVAGNADGYLQSLEKEIENAKDEDMAALGEKFPRGGAVGILEKHPDLLERYEKLAIKYAEKGIVAPANVLWSHYFVSNEEQKAEEVWKKYLEGSPRIMFQRVVQRARETNDEHLTEKLIEHLKTSKVTDGAIGNAYSCLLDILVSKDKSEEAISTFEKAIKTVPIDYINRTAVLRVKSVYEKVGKPFTHTVPPKNVKKQSSSSSSSEEEAARKM